MKDLLKPIVIGLSILIAVIIASVTFFNRSKADDVVAVTGSGSIDFDSDLVVWRANFAETASDLKAAYKKLQNDREAVSRYLVAQGIPERDITYLAVDIAHKFDTRYNAAGDAVGEIFTGYQLRQAFKVESKQLDTVETVSRSVTDLINEGIELSSDSPDYFYSKLADLKLDLVAKATQDARNRALNIAQNAGAHIGKVRFSDLGVIQIVERNSAIEATWQGNFDTKARYKTASLTVHVQFELW